MQAFGSTVNLHEIIPQGLKPVSIFSILRHATHPLGGFPGRALTLNRCSFAVYIAHSFHPIHYQVFFFHGVPTRCLATIGRAAKWHIPEIYEQAVRTMTLRLFNTLTGQIDELVPTDGKALRMYACGPTVYDYGHIGNFRTFLQVDVLRRFLRLSGMRSAPRDEHYRRGRQDHPQRRGRRNCRSASTPPRYEQAFFEDLEALGIERPEHDCARYRAYSAAWWS